MLLVSCSATIQFFWPLAAVEHSAPSYCICKEREWLQVHQNLCNILPPTRSACTESGIHALLRNITHDTDFFAVKVLYSGKLSS